LSSLGVVFGLLANAGAILGLFTAVICLHKRWVRQNYSQELLLLPWFFGILGVVVVLDLQLRYGYGFHIVAVPLTLAIVAKAPRLPVRLFAAAILIAVAVQGAEQFRTNSGCLGSRLSRGLCSTLQANGDKYDRLYILNDPVNSTAGKWIQEFVAAAGGGQVHASGQRSIGGKGGKGPFAEKRASPQQARERLRVRSEVVIVNEIRAGDSDLVRQGTVTTNVQRDGNGCRVMIRVAKPAVLWLQGGPLNKVWENHGTVTMGNRKYEFPEFTATPSRTGTSTHFDLGSTMKVHIADSGHSALITFDAASQRYRVLEF